MKDLNEEQSDSQENDKITINLYSKIADNDKLASSKHQERPRSKIYKRDIKSS